MMVMHLAQIGNDFLGESSSTSPDLDMDVNYLRTTGGLRFEAGI